MEGDYLKSLSNSESGENIDDERIRELQEKAGKQYIQDILEGYLNGKRLKEKQGTGYMSDSLAEMKDYSVYFGKGMSKVDAEMLYKWERNDINFFKNMREHLTFEKDKIIIKLDDSHYILFPRKQPTFNHIDEDFKDNKNCRVITEQDGIKLLNLFISNGKEFKELLGLVNNSYWIEDNERYGKQKISFNDLESNNKNHRIKIIHKSKLEGVEYEKINPLIKINTTM